MLISIKILIDNQLGPTYFIVQEILLNIFVAAWLIGEFGGEWICVYEWLSPFAIYLKLSQHLAI